MNNDMKNRIAMKEGIKGPFFTVLFLVFSLKLPPWQQNTLLEINKLTNEEIHKKY